MEAIGKSLEKIANAAGGDRIPVIWGVYKAFSDENKLKYSHKRLYEYWDVLKVDVQKNGKYTFCSDMFYRGHDLIRECAKYFGYCKWRRLFGFQLEFTYDELRYVLYKTHELHKSYEGTGHVYKKCFYTMEEARIYRDELNAPLIKEDKEKHLEELKIEMSELLEKTEENADEKENTQKNSAPIKLFRKKRI